MLCAEWFYREHVTQMIRTEHLGGGGGANNVTHIAESLFAFTSIVVECSLGSF